MAQPGPIPLRNIWLLFLYAADLVQFRDRFQSDVEAAKDLPDGPVQRDRALASVARVRRLRARLVRPHPTAAGIAAVLNDPQTHALRSALADL